MATRPDAGAEAVLFGPGDRGEPTAQDWAEAAGTIAYEIVTRIGARVPRVYVNETADEVTGGVPR
nr:alanine racemase C-terminal domain-containing protein [Streptomyces globisporus]